MIRALILTLALLISGPVLASSPGPDEIMQDPALEARASQLYGQLRCVVCQSQSLAHSNATLASDMRAVVRERLLAGQSNQEILDYMQVRYGDYVLMLPPLQGNTLILWLMPGLLLLGGGIGIGVFLRQQNRRANTAAAEALDPAEQARLAELMAEEGQE
jgi:cytochrome c-type biogenesis protein CcmH